MNCRELNDYDVLVLPGWHGSGEAHWQTAWQKALPTLRRVEQADWERPYYSAWAERLDQAVAASTRPVILVAHSLGTSLAVRWSLQHLSAPVAGMFLVAPTDIGRFVGQPDTEVVGFDPIPEARLPFPTTVIASRNDERVDFGRAQDFAAAWGARLVDAGQLGHMGSAAALGLWPQGLIWFGQFLATLSSD
jgi:predicted alpha/beta hydrolase family esterase